MCWRNFLGIRSTDDLLWSCVVQLHSEVGGISTRRALSWGLVYSHNPWPLHPLYRRRSCYRMPKTEWLRIKIKIPRSISPSYSFSVSVLYFTMCCKCLSWRILLWCCYLIPTYMYIYLLLHIVTAIRGWCVEHITRVRSGGWRYRGHSSRSNTRHWCYCHSQRSSRSSHTNWEVSSSW